METNRFESAQSDVGKVFATPKDLLTAKDVTAGQKAELLKQWERDLRQILVASDEGMTSSTPGPTANLLSDIQNALGELGANDDHAKTPDHAGG